MGLIPGVMARIAAALITVGGLAAQQAPATNLEVLQLRPNFAEAQFQLANLQFDHGELPAARAGIDNYIGTYNATADLLLLAVRVARAQGDRLRPRLPQ